MNANNNPGGQNTENGLGANVENMADKAQEKLRDASKSTMRAGEDAGTSVKRKVEDVSDMAHDKAGDLADSMKSDDAAGGMGGLVRKAQDTAYQAKDAVMNTAGSTFNAVRDVAMEKAEDARESLSSVGDRLAETLQRASGEEDSDALKSRVLTSVAQGLTTASDALRQRSVSEIAEDVKLLAKRHPGAFMAAAAVIGFAAARFIRSSAQRDTDYARNDFGKGPHS